MPERHEQSWNAENRLVKAENDSTKLEFTYDYMGRRIQKQVYAWDAASDLWSLTSDLRYVYDGWNLIQTLDAQDSNAGVKDFTWGLDLSQSLQGAGGVGGLLAVTEHGETADTPYYTTYDANGNVSEYLESDGSVVAHYEYSPFGRLTLVDSETGAPDFNHRFSTKFLDTETRLYYYGYRYYLPELGRWCSRDPIREVAGLNLFAFIGNCTLNMVDRLGLAKIESDGKLIEDSIKNLRSHVKTWNSVNGILDKQGKDGTMSNYGIEQLKRIQAKTGIQIVKDGKVLTDNIGKLKNFYDKLSLLADVIEGKKDADVRSVETLSEEFVEKAIGLTPMGKIGGKVLIGSANFGTGIGNWMVEKLYPIIDRVGCKCCAIGYILDGKRGEYRGEKPTGGGVGGRPKCYGADDAYYVMTTRIPSGPGDSFFASLYKNTFKEAEKFYVKCP